MDFFHDFFVEIPMGFSPFHHLLKSSWLKAPLAPAGNAGNAGNAGIAGNMEP